VNHGCRFMTQLTFDKKAGGLLAHCE